MGLADAWDLVSAIAADAIKPDPILTVDEWADRYRVLSQRASAEPGRWRTDRTPYLREVMQELSGTSPEEKVVLMAGAQLGKTECGNNFLGWIIQNSPGPTMMVQPTVDMAKRNSKTRIAPLIEECPELRKRVKDPRSRDSGNALLSKEFLGGIVILAGANSGSGLRSTPIRFLHLDECDAFPGDVDGEGDPCMLAEARTRTFSRRKIFYTSTPTISGQSRIEREYLDSDMRVYEIACPHCGAWQQLLWPQMVWPEGEPELARYKCAHCEEEIEEHHKNKFLAEGRWVPQNPEGKWAGFHISTLYSPLGWYSWADCARQYEQAKKTDEGMKVFQNTILGVSYADTGEAPDWELLYNRREEYKQGTVPDGVVFLTCGADVQGDRIEIETIGWGRNLESWSVDYTVISGDTADDEVWEELSKFVRTTYPTSSGLHLPIRMFAIDSGFRTQEVYRWVRSQSAVRTMAIKGRDNLSTVLGLPSPVDMTVRGKKIRSGIKVWTVGSSILKSELYGWLRRKMPTDLADGFPYGWCHFPQYPEEYFKQLTAESVVSRIVRGYQKFQWEKQRERNEALDVRCYARAAAEAIGVSRWDDARWEHEEKSAGVAVQQAQTTTKRSENKVKRRRSGFL